MVATLADLQYKYFGRGGSSSAPIFTSMTPTAVLAADVISGLVSHVATTAATTVITVPAGRTWQGAVSIQAAVANAAANAVAGSSRAVLSIAGAGAAPSGNIAAVEVKCGANAATGTVGSQDSNSINIPITIVADAVAATLQVTSTIAGTSGSVDVSASGRLL